MKMRKIISMLTLALLTLSLTKSAKITNEENTMKPDDLAKMTPQPRSDDEVDLMEIMVTCNDSFRIEMDFLQSLNDSGSFPDETDKTPKCFVRCVLEKARIASDDSQFDAARAAAVLPPSRNGQDMDVTNMAAACAERKETCKCERAYQFMKCLIEMEIEKYEMGQ